MFTRAVKTDAKLRLALAGPPGAGKTFSALTLAHALAEGQGVALIDTEHGSASKYADLFPPFDSVNLETFHPDLYVEAIKAAERAGYAVLIIDSLSHAWNGKGGLLELVDGIARRSKSGNTYVAWGEATPIQNRLIDTMLGAKLHVIATMRSKMEYAQEKDEQTHRTIIRKLGLAPIQRDGVEYEMDVVGDLDTEHTLFIQKSRCPALSGAIIPRPGPDIADILRSWLSGVPPAEVERAALAAQITYLRAALGEAAPDVAGMEQATEEQLRRERSRLTMKHAETVR
jgi:hypothetical protein